MKKISKKRVAIGKKWKKRGRREKKVAIQDNGLMEIEKSWQVAHSNWLWILFIYFTLISEWLCLFEFAACLIMIKYWEDENGTSEQERWFIFSLLSGQWIVANTKNVERGSTMKKNKTAKIDLSSFPESIHCLHRKALHYKTDALYIHWIENFFFHTIFPYQKVCLCNSTIESSA